MDESPDKSPNKGEAPKNETITTSFDEPVTDGADTAQPQPAAGDSAESRLPAVWSPTLAADNAESDSAAPGPDALATSASGEPATDATMKEPAAAATAAPPRTRRFALLAATVALTAGLSSFIGALTASGIGRLLVAPHVPAVANGAETDSLARALQAQATALAGLKAALEDAAHDASGQLAALGDRLDRVEHAQAPTDAADRIAKLGSAADVTGSTGAGTVAPTEAKLTDRILQDWIVQDVRGGRALVESRYGGLFDVGAGSVLPGVGRVDGVKRQDGEWVVVTAHGLITSGH